MNDTAKAQERHGERGFSLLQLLIVAAIISIVSSYAIMQISAAQQAMRLSSSARELMGNIEKARIDSIRRHAMTTAQMASISITDNRSYIVTMDSNGDGTVETRTINISQSQGVTINTGSTPLPITIRYNWRGRPTTVDGNGTTITPSFSLQDGSGRSSTINITNAGDIGISGYDSTGSNANVSAPTISTVSTSANIRTETQVP